MNGSVLQLDWMYFYYFSWNLIGLNGILLYRIGKNLILWNVIQLDWKEPFYEMKFNCIGWNVNFLKKNQIEWNCIAIELNAFYHIYEIKLDCMESYCIGLIGVPNSIGLNERNFFKKFKTNGTVFQWDWMDFCYIY